MNNIVSTISLFLALALIACEKENEKLGVNPDQLIGSWFNPDYGDSIVSFERSSSLIVDEYGFSFNEDKSFIERKNSGWCGTPPISYADFDGTWTKNDSLIQISVGYWGGTSDYKWKIVSLDEAMLKVIIIELSYNLENQ